MQLNDQKSNCIPFEIRGKIEIISSNIEVDEKMKRKESKNKQKEIYFKDILIK